MEIHISCELNSGNARKFADDLYKNRDADSLSINISELKFVYPFSTLFLLSAIWSAVDYRKSKNLLPTQITYNKGNLSNTYLGYFGFFKQLGIDFGNKVCSQQGSTFIPISEIKFKTIENESIERKIPIQEIIQERAESLIKIILPHTKYENEEDQLLSYSLREIIRNCFEHGSARSCYIMGQRWSNGYAELAILDRGIGIKNALQKKFSIKDNKTALNLAISPGISSGNINSQDYYANSGFGLYITSELCKRYGVFVLCSSDGMLTINRDGSPSYVETPPLGTIVRLRMNINNGEYFPNVKQLIIQEGEKIATMATGSDIKASKASKN